MRFPNNYFYSFKRADVFPTLPPGLPAFFNDECDVPVMKHPTMARHLLMRAWKMKVVMMRTMVTMVITWRMTQVAHPKPKRKRKRKLNQSPKR